MKKIILSLLMLATLSVSGCSCWQDKDTNKFVELKENERIVVDGETLFNYVNETTTEVYFSRIESRVHSLRRSYYQPSGNSALYEGYYYYWNTQEGSESVHVGTKTTKNIVKYSYIEIEQNQKIMIKKTDTQIETYDYKSSWVHFNPTDEYELNGYFNNMEELETASFKLASLINENELEHEYVRGDESKHVSSNVKYMENYYYFERV